MKLSFSYDTDLLVSAFIAAQHIPYAKITKTAVRF